MTHTHDDSVIELIAMHDRAWSDNKFKVFGSHSTTELAKQNWPHHDSLLDSAIPCHHAGIAGCRYVRSRDDFPFGSWPDVGWAFEEAGPGLLFMHEGAGGSHHPRAIAQFRPDKPTANVGKYCQAKDSGSLVSIHPARRELMHRAGRRVLIQEGTKQALAMACFAPADVLVLGVQGCHNWSSEGIPAEWLKPLVQGASEVIVSFDADVKTNRNVWSAGDRLRDVLGTFGIEKVRFIHLPYGSNSGIDDALGADSTIRNAVKAMNALREGDGFWSEDHAVRRGFTEATNQIENLIKQARTLPRRGPAASKVSTQLTIDWDQAQIRRTIQEGGEGEVQAGFAARVTTTYSEVDDLDPSVRRSASHDVEVKLSDGSVHTVRGISDKNLGMVDALLEQVPFGTAVHRPTNDLAFNAAFATAIRIFEADDREYVTRLARTGWARDELSGQWRYATPRGALGADGRHKAPVAGISHLGIGFDEVTEEQTVGAVKDVLAARNTLSDPGAFWLGLGLTTTALIGVRPRGSLVLLGEKGSGKTTVMRFWSSSVYPKRWASSFSFQSTKGVVGQAGATLEHCIADIDDLKRTNSERVRQESFEGLDLILRRGYDGGSAGRGRLVKAENGRYVDSPPDPCSPAFVLSAEVLPSAEDSASTVERALVSEFKSETLLPGGARRLEDLARTGTTNAAMHGLVKWVAAHLNENGDFASWKQKFEAQMIEHQQHLVALLPDTSPRVAEVASTFLIGINAFLTYALELGAIDEAEALELATEGTQSVAKAVASHTNDRMSDSVPPEESMLSAIRGLLASERGFIDDGTGQMMAMGYTTCIGGHHVRKDDQKLVIILDPDSVAKVLGGGMTAARVRAALRPVALPHPTTNRKRHTASVRGVKISNALAVEPGHFWADSETDGEAQSLAEASVEMARVSLELAQARLQALSDPVF